MADVSGQPGHTRIYGQFFINTEGVKGNHKIEALVTNLQTVRTLRPWRNPRKSLVVMF